MCVCVDTEVITVCVCVWIQRLSLCVWVDEGGASEEAHVIITMVTKHMDGLVVRPSAIYITTCT